MQLLRIAGVAVAAVLALAGCGGSGGGGSGAAAPAAPPPTPAPALPAAAEAARFLTQASFGPTDASIAAVRASGYAGWIDQQIAMPASGSHQTWVDNRLIEIRAQNPQLQLQRAQFYESFWFRAATGPDELRQRVAFALSEIFVISLADPGVDVRGAASYYDMLWTNAFGNYRTLLEQVSLHPMMGIYLTHLGNQKEDPATGRNPDENYAREVMQLMSIGLYQLGPDGVVRTSGSAPIPAYTADDISGLAKVFTGFSWYAPAPNANTFAGRGRPADAVVRPMIPYAAFHSTSAKSFLGTTIPAGGADAAADLRVALDTIANHPNVGPFISKQLIQRLVTSNPSPAYVGRVAAVFNSNGQGARGDLGAVVRAILLDPEARDAANAAAPSYGKLREPVVRLANWMRAFNARSQSTTWLMASTSANTSLNQSPLTSNSVFNFFRPGYSPPNTRMGQAGLVAPELQIVDEVSAVGYLNTIQTAINTGIGARSDIASTYATEVPLAGDVGALLDRVNLLLTYGQMSPTLRTRISEAVSAVPIPGGTATPAQISAAQLNRVKLAVFLTMVSPEYLSQR
jgi:uncharacterized protein (DUF1800 family)